MSSKDSFLFRVKEINEINMPTGVFNGFTFDSFKPEAFSERLPSMEFQCLNKYKRSVYSLSIIIYGNITYM